MRISQFEKESIIKNAKYIFGNEATVTLFGSRADMKKKGGDIDIFIDTRDKNELTVKNKLFFLVALKNDIGEQKIDVILDTPYSKNINKTAIKTGLRLC